jgi:outer membrane protein, heavy metal efflux system
MSCGGSSAVSGVPRRADRLGVRGLVLVTGLALAPAAVPAVRAAGGPSDTAAAPVIDLATSATLADVLRLAEAANPGLRAAHERWAAAREKEAQASSLPDPRFSYTYFVEPVETRVGPQRRKFGLSQTVPLFRLGLRGDVARREADAAEARRDAAVAELRLRVTRAWSDYYYLGRAIAVTADNVGLLRRVENVALTRYSSGQAPQSTVIRTQLELAKLEDRLRSLEDRRRPALAALNAEMDREPAEPVAWPDALAHPEVADDPAAIEAAMRAWNPELRVLRAGAAKQAAAARLAGRSSLPELTLGAEVIDTDEAAMPGVKDSGKNAVTATASVNLPLWFGRNRAERAEAEAGRAAAESELAQRENALAAELESVRYDLRDADRRVDLYEFTLLPKARQSLSVMEDAFRTGEASFLDLVDAQRTLLELELAFERSLADRATGVAALERIAGPQVAPGPNGGQ